MAETTKSIPVTFANSGIVLKSAPDEIPITAYKALLNMFTDQENSASVRKGFSRLNDGLPSPPHSSYILKDYQGVVWRYAIAGGKIYIAQVSPVWGPFVAVIGGDNLSAAADPRAFFASYTLSGSEIKPFIFLADGKAFLKNLGGVEPARRIGIPMPTSGIVTIAQQANTVTSIEAFEDHTLWTAVNATLATIAGGVTANCVEFAVTGGTATGYAYKALLATTLDLNNADLEQSIQFYVKLPTDADVTNFGSAKIQFNLSTTPSDTSFTNVMTAPFDLTGIVPGGWVLKQIPKKDFVFSGINTALDWSTVTAIKIDLTVSDSPIANPSKGGALTCALYVDECGLNETGQVSGVDLQWTFTYYNSKTDTESDYATPTVNPFVTTEYSQFNLTLPPCPLTTPPLADPDKIRIYRMGGTITQFQLVDEIAYTPGAIPPVYTDAIPDSALGDVLDYENQLPPDSPAGMDVYDNRLWTWGGTYTDSTGAVIPEPPNRLRFSKRTNIEEFPAQNYVYVGSGSEAIQRVMEHDGEMFIFTQTRVWRMTGSDLSSYNPVSTAVNQGLKSPFGVCRGTRQIFMYSYDGIYEYPSGTKISEPVNQIFFNESVNQMPPIEAGREHEVAMSFWNSKLYFSYARTDDPTITNDSMLLWDIIYQRWHFYLYGCQGLFTESETQFLVGSNVFQWDSMVDGAPANFAYAGPWVMHLENGFVDECQSEDRGIFYVLDTKEFDLGYPDQEKRFIDYVIDADTLGFSLQIQASFDGGLYDPLGHVRTTGREQKILPVLIGEGDSFLARRTSIRVIGRQETTATGSTRLYKFVHRVLLEPMRHRTFVTEWHDYGTPTPKFLRELWAELDTFGRPLDRIEVQIDQALGAIVGQNISATGRTKFFFGLPIDLRGTLARLKIVPTGDNEVKLYDHGIQVIAEPPQINTYQMPWSEEQWPYPKLWKEAVFDIDTNNQPLDFNFWLDGVIHETFTIQTNGRRLVTKSLEKDSFGKLGRITASETYLDPFCCLPQGARVYSVRFVIDKDPADVTLADSYEQLFTYDRTKIIRRLWIAMKNPDAAVTMEIYADDVLASTKTIPVDIRLTGHNKKRIDLESAIEGRLFRIIFSSPFAFQLYWEKSEVEMKGTNTEDGYGRYKLQPPQTF